MTDPSPSLSPSPFLPFPPTARKKPRSFNWFEKDLEDLDEYFSLIERGYAIAGKRPPFLKTDYIRDVLHNHMNSVVRPQLEIFRGKSSPSEIIDEI